MDSSKVEVDFEIPEFIRVYKDGRAERVVLPEFVPPSFDPCTGVSSKDILIEPQTGFAARLYLPKLTPHHAQKLPLMVYFHGSGFVVESAFSPIFHSYVNALVAEANVVAVSVDYRKAPEYLLPIAYEDSWTALEWIFSQSQSDEKDDWFDKYVDFDRVFMVGDSAGANITHNMAIRVGLSESYSGLKIDGIVLIQPYFAGVELIEGESTDNVATELAWKTWKVVCPWSEGLDDPLMNPAMDPNLSKLGCKRVLVCIAESDGLGCRGKFYYDSLQKSGWNGVVELTETPGEDHAFHIIDPTSQKAKDLIKGVASFINTKGTQVGYLYWRRRRQDIYSGNNRKNALLALASEEPQIPAGGAAPLDQQDHPEQ